MISRRLLLVDRVLALVVGLALLAGGAAATWWSTGMSPVDDTLDTGVLSDLVGRSWWPWAAGAAGVVLVLLGLRWLVAHLSTPRVRRLSLRGSARGGSLSLNASSAVSAAADAYTDTLGVRSARALATRDRGQLVVRLRAVAEPSADLALLARRADEVSAQLHQVLGRDDLRFSLDLRVAGRGRSVTRVR